MKTLEPLDPDATFAQMGLDTDDDQRKFAFATPIDQTPPVIAYAVAFRTKLAMLRMSSVEIAADGQSYELVRQRELTRLIEKYRQKSDRLLLSLAIKTVQAT